jgi:hypothetical protein
MLKLVTWVAITRFPRSLIEFAYQQAISVPGEPVVKRPTAWRWKTMFQRVQLKVPGEEHHFAQTYGSLCQNCQSRSNYVLSHVKCRRYRMWSRRSKQQTRMSLLTGCKTNTTAVCFAEKAYFCRRGKSIKRLG